MHALIGGPGLPARHRPLLLLVGALIVCAGTPAVSLAQPANAERLAGVETLGWPVGNEDAPVTVVEFTDVSCPFCASFQRGTRAALREEFVESHQVRWITLSYVSGLYPNSGTLSVAAECAGQQGRFEAFMEAAYADRDSWLRAGDTAISAVIEDLAEATDLEMTGFVSCLLDVSPAERIRKITELARELGVRGTPTWFVEGFPVMGDLPLEYARSFITSQLGR
ncbi:MAG: DsbA family protein [Longimicrobiales bacterium]